MFGFAVGLTVSFACLAPRLLRSRGAADRVGTLALPRVQPHPGIRRRLVAMALLIFAICLGLDRLQHC